MQGGDAGLARALAAGSGEASLLLRVVVTYALGDVDLALIECTSPSGRGILYLVEIANDATEHVREDFVAVCDCAHSSFLCLTRSRLPGSRFE